jgi:RNA polymerase sigma-70 factor, ECF subfamily
MSLSRDDIARVYREHGFRVYYRALRLVGSEAEAKDVVQEVFVSLLQKQAALREPEKLAPWLLKVTTNRALNRIRTHASRREALEGLRLSELDIQLSGASKAGDQDQVDRGTVRRLLDDADDLSREIVLAYYFDGLTLQEVADLYRLSVASAHRRLKRFLAASRKRLEHDMDLHAAREGGHDEQA